MPALKDVVGVVKYDQALDQRASDERDGRKPGLPSQDGDPAYEIAEESLAASGRELADPVILPTRCRCPRLLLV